MIVVALVMGIVAAVVDDGVSNLSVFIINWITLVSPSFSVFDCLSALHSLQSLSLAYAF
jgi:predicted benzoate:H+ symporter BenE